MNLTDEQEAVVASGADFLRVTAFAGTGKTSTLVAYANARPNVRMLYVAFNKALQMEAARKFPKNVVCRTTHALAFSTEGKRYSHKLLNGNLRPLELLKALGVSLGQPGAYRFAGRVQRALLNFLASSHLTIDESIGCDESVDPKYAKGRARLLSATQRIWDLMTNPTDTNIGMLHDGYLKLYQLTNPSLPFDCILFDEAQDANPVTTDIVVSQKCRKVFVGDRHQQIYTFRGAVDSMAREDFDRTLYLTNSFRFGEKIARMANVILRIKNESEKVKGVRVRPPSETEAFISRGNAALFRKAVAVVKDKQVPCFVGGIEGYKLEMVRDIYFLYAKDKRSIRNSFIRHFDNFESLSDYSTALEERDLMAWVKIVKDYEHEIPELVDSILAANVSDSNCADLSLSTVHKSKGLEFGSVTLGEDFPSYSFVKETEEVRGDEEELNLLYVAITRAEQRLETNSVFQALEAHLTKNPAARLLMLAERAGAEPTSVVEALGISASKQGNTGAELSPHQILFALAGGLDPWSGKRMGNDQIANRIEVRDAIGSLLATATPEAIRNAGRPWNQSEDAQLREKFTNKLTVAELARFHKRTEGAIRSRLSKLGLIG